MFTLPKLKRLCYNFFILFLILIFFILPSFFISFSIFIIILINVFYFITNFIKISLFINGLSKYKYGQYYEKCDLVIANDKLPTYTILLPVRREKEFILTNLLNSINSLDYAKEKLDIKIIVDEDDCSTINVCKNLKNSFNFDLIIVPKSQIRSKPLSCNYALKFIKGKYLTIYDAEDKPEKYQLKKAIKKFNELDDNYLCLQAALNYYNKYDNYLSYYFSIEYSMWFDFTLTPLSKFSNFFPLGGTSNHFKSDKLIEIGGWDGYNVTEDAELGIRIIKAGYKVSTIKSITNEECPTTLIAWLKQRTRWIKGFIQTFCEHIIFKKPLGIKTKMKFKRIHQLRFIDFLTFYIFIGMSFFFFLSILIVFFNHVLLLKLYDMNYLKYLINFNMFSLFFMIYGSFIAIIIKNKIKFNLIYFIFFPFYWILHYIAGFRALYFLVVSPFYWSKTEHGVSKFFKKQLPLLIISYLLYLS